ncbi:MAG: flavodoxin domain-containing protein [Clostridia bacterium]|nr:flavodoxin domain-containing protein [Clostridia bacterium]
MNTLILYTSKHGTTEKCASMLSKMLTGKVELHNLKLKEPAPDLSQYDKVIVGGSIYAGRLQKEASQFCLQNLTVLKNKKMGLFLCCMFKDNAEAQFKSAFAEEVLNAAATKGCFGGELLFSKMNFAERFITKVVSKAAAKNDPNLPAVDMKKDMSMIDEDAINAFAQIMNKA